MKIKIQILGPEIIPIDERTFLLIHGDTFLNGSAAEGGTLDQNLLYFKQLFQVEIAAEGFARWQVLSSLFFQQLAYVFSHSCHWEPPF
jgi:hypothetical protein